MSYTMCLRTLYLPASAPGIDTGRATTTIQDLCRHATTGHLRTLLQHGVIDDPSLLDGATLHDAAITAIADRLRAQAEHRLLQQLHALAGSLHGRDVIREIFTSASDTPVVAFHTGGLTSSDEGPTDAYDDWDLVFAVDRLPAGWADRIGAAAGLWHPQGTGPATATATFHTWA